MNTRKGSYGEKNVWYFGNAQFHALLRKGVICSLKRTNDIYDTEYAEEKRGFGAVYLCYRDGDEPKEFCPNESDSFAEEPPAFRDNALISSGKAADDAVEASVVWSLKGSRMYQKVTVKNISDKTVHVTDLGIQHFCRTDFKWGVNANPNVIGHHYVGGTVPTPPIIV